MQFIEEVLSQILPAVIEPVDMIFVQSKHRAQMLLRQVLSFVGADCNAALLHFTPLALDLVAAVAAKAAEIIIEGPETVVLPMKLDSHARKEAHLFQRLALV